jgi:ATP-binding cassette subfamily F protein uup
MLAAYPGTLLLVSHDRDFLDRVVTSVVASEGDGGWQEYAGGYSDMLAQRGAPLGTALAPPRERGKPKPASAAATADSAASPLQRRKLSFAEQHALKTLPVRMEKLTDDLRRLEEILGQPDLYRKDPATFTRTTMALATARAALTEVEEQWLAAELRREEVEGR